MRRWIRLNTKRVLALSVAGGLLGWGVQTYAQWVTQENNLTEGWNAVYLHVDTSYTSLENLVENPIQEIWLWEPAPVQQFIDSPLEPTGKGSRWMSWNRTNQLSSGLERLMGNAAYLIRISKPSPNSNGSSNFVWRVKGRPLPPSYSWSSTGLNFLGFPTPTSDPPTLMEFFEPEPGFLAQAKIYRYAGGELDTNNPTLVSPFDSSFLLRRDQAYWIEAGDRFHRYFGPFEVNLLNPSGLAFRNSIGQSRIRLRNRTDEQLTITLELLPSEPAPAGQPLITDVPPLLLRGTLDTNSLRFSSTRLTDAPRAWVLVPKGQPGSEVELVVGLNRDELNENGHPGELYAGILRLTDSLNLSQVEIPVSAEVETSTAGLWVGQASVASVDHALQSYVTITNETGSAQLVEELHLNDESVSPRAFSRSPKNISTRPRTRTSVVWEPAEWTVPGASNDRQRTPDLSGLLQELVQSPTWKPDHALVFVVTGKGRRTAASYNGDEQGAPKLTVEYTFHQDEGGFEAYNDLSWAPGQLAQNITLFTTSAGPSAPPFGNQGMLVDYATGTHTPVTLSVEGGNWNSAAHTEIGALSSVGTDGYGTFHGKVDTTGVINYSTTDLVLTFSGLSTGSLYELVVFGNRDRVSYADRLSETTLSGAEGFRNESTLGSVFSGPSSDTTVIVNGYNTERGHVARFSQIAPGADGTIVLTQSDGGSARPPKFYINAVYLKSTKRPIAMQTQVARSSHDAEEQVQDGRVSLSSSDLELGEDKGRPQEVGIRFEELSLPRGATILSSHIQFTTDEVSTGSASLRIEAEVPPVTRYAWEAESGRILVFGGPENLQGSYLKDGPKKTAAGTVARPFPLRLIIHNDGTSARLLQRVYHGLDKKTNTVVATQEELLLPTHLKQARRISSVHLPTSEANIPWAFDGSIHVGANIRTTVDLSFDDQVSNPFLHTYHPDHDNLDPFFAPISRSGAESYGINRTITLNFRSPDEDDFDSLTQGNQTLSGDYAERVSFRARDNHTQEYNVRGSFRLNKISDIDTLTTP